MRRALHLPSLLRSAQKWLRTVPVEVVYIVSFSIADCASALIDTHRNRLDL